MIKSAACNSHHIRSIQAVILSIEPLAARLGLVFTFVLSENVKLRHELTDGRAAVLPPAAVRHQRAAVLPLAGSSLVFIDVVKVADVTDSVDAHETGDTLHVVVSAHVQ